MLTSDQQNRLFLKDKQNFHLLNEEKKNTFRGKSFYSVCKKIKKLNSAGDVKIKVTSCKPHSSLNIDIYYIYS